MNNTPERSGDVEVRIPVKVCECGAWAVFSPRSTPGSIRDTKVYCPCIHIASTAVYYVTATLVRPTPQPAREVPGEVSQ